MCPTPAKLVHSTITQQFPGRFAQRFASKFPQNKCFPTTLEGTSSTYNNPHRMFATHQKFHKTHHKNMTPEKIWRLVRRKEYKLIPHNLLQSIRQCQIAIILEDCCWEGCREGPCFIGQGGHSKICHSLLQLLYKICPSQQHFSRGIGCSSWEGLLRILPARVFYEQMFWRSIGKNCFHVSGADRHCCYQGICESYLVSGLAQGYPKPLEATCWKNVPAHCSGRSLLVSKNSVKESGQKKCRELHKSWKTFGINMLWIFKKAKL